MSRPDFEASIARLTRRVDAALAQSRRFDVLAERVHNWAENWSVAAIARWLYADGQPTRRTECALVALALKGTDEAGEVLRGYDAGERDEDHHLLWQVALIEWEQRWDDTVYEAVA
mgnify:CR=1 FL=1